MWYRGDIQKDLDPRLRLPITSIPPSDDESIWETVWLMERFRSPEDDVGAPKPSRAWKNQNKSKNQVNGNGLQQSQSRNLQLFSPWNVS